MRVAVTSDLHHGITSSAAIRSLAAAIASADPDAVVLAGDCAEGPSLWLDCLRIFTEACPDAIRAVVPGNHDLWAREESTSEDLFRRLLPALSRDAGFSWLEGSPLVRGGVALAGTIAWYDYSAATPDLPWGPAWYAAHKREVTRDAEALDPGWDDRAFAAERGRALLADLDALEADPAVREVLVVTHVPLLEEQMDRRPWDPRWSAGTAYFGNLTLGAEVLRRAKVSTVVSGHTHGGRRTSVHRKDHPPVAALVVGSDFHRPAFVTVEVGSAGTER